MDELLRISRWMAFWAPEVKRRADAGQAEFAAVRDAYEALRASPRGPDDVAAYKAAAAPAEKTLSEEPVPARLAHVGRWVS